MAKRFNGYDKTHDCFSDKKLVVCPKCSKKAQYIVLNNQMNERGIESKRKLTCISCGFSRKYHHDHLYPGFQMWLRKEMPEGILFAYNYEHLDYLEKHISAELRVRNPNDIRNKSI